MHRKSRSKIAPSNSNRRKQALCHQRSRLEGDNGLFHSPIVVHVLKKGNPCLHVVGIQHIIEQSDLIHTFGDFVVQQVTQEAQILRKVYGNDFRVTFNVSPAQLKGSKSLVEHWRSLVGTTSFEDVGLIAEITEGMMVDNDSFTQHNLLSLHTAGIGVAIDDFGTGYSSLNYLTKINAQVIKIDKSFTSNLIVNPKTDALCEAIIAMAHKMGMQVVAEGVETQAQWNKLADIGCDMAQGYFIAKPMPLETLLATWKNQVAPVPHTALAS